MKNFFIMLFSLFVVGCATLAFAQDIDSEQIDLLIQKYVNTGYVGVDVINADTGTTLYEYHADKYFTPASNTKLFTAAAALYYLHPDFKYQTTVLIQKDQMKKAALNGNLYIHFVGDPSLTQADLKTLVRDVKKQGITQINGNVVLDDSWLSKPDYPSEMSYEDMHWYYGAPDSTITANENAVNLRFIPSNKIGDPVVVKPAKGMEWMGLQNQITTVSTQQAANHCQLIIDADEQNKINLSGCWPMDGDIKSLRLAVRNPALFAASMIRTFLKDEHIQLKGDIIVGKTPDSTTIIATHSSPPLSDLIQPMLKNSDNLYAELITKALGKAYYGRGTIQEGANAIRAILNKRAHVFLPERTLYDGAGSSYNLVTPNQLTHILSSVYHDKNIRDIFVSALPKSGLWTDGTFSKISIFSHELPRNIQAKTGSIKSASTLAGYMTTKNKTHLIFVIMANNVMGKLHAARQLQVAVCQMLSEKV